MRHLFVFWVLSLILLSGCEENLKDSVEICPNCYDTEPDYTYLIVEFSRDNVQRSPKIILLGGLWEEHNILDTIETDTVPAFRDYVQIAVGLDRYYTVCAVYLRQGDTVYAIDGNFIFAQEVYSNDCDTFCWQIKSRYLNVKLKNTNL